jgi:predicted acylesterase/phospholipase RssA
VFQAAFLVHLERRLGAPLWQHFDLIAGTSTGSAIGVALALEIPPAKILEFYREHALDIFNARALDVIRKGPQYDAHKLEAPLKELFADRQLKEAKTRILVPSSSLDRFAPRVFTAMPELAGPDGDMLAVDVVLASSAAPTYFKAHQPTGDDRAYVDGGMWANSPALVAVLMVNRRLRVPFSHIRLVSIGNGDFPNGIAPGEFNSLRKIQRRTIHTNIEIMFSCQAGFAQEYSRELVGSGHSVRVNTNLQEPLALDDAQAALTKLPPLAGIADETYGPSIAQLLSTGSADGQSDNTIRLVPSQWQTEWLFEDGSLYVRDTVSFATWTETHRFEGFGAAEHKNKTYRYTLAGEVSRNGVVALMYWAEGAPTESNIGTACLLLSSDARQLDGFWIGLVAPKDRDGNRVARLASGKVSMRRMD